MTPNDEVPCRVVRIRVPSLRRRRGPQRGAASAEVGLLVALISAVAISGMFVLGNQVQQWFKLPGVPSQSQAGTDQGDGGPANNGADGSSVHVTLTPAPKGSCSTATTDPSSDPSCPTDSSTETAGSSDASGTPEASTTSDTPPPSDTAVSVPSSS